MLDRNEPSQNIDMDSNPKPPPAANMEGSDKKLIVCFLGIFVSYFIYGILQENITKSTYGENNEKFQYVQALVFIQCIINAAFAKTAMSVQPSSTPDLTSKKTYALMTFFYVSAMLSSNQALSYVSYPTQVLGKSAKPIPVMILGVLLARKRYPLAKYLFVLMIVVGVALFMYKDKKAAAAGPSSGYGYGEILLLVSLTFDGLTGAVQERMRSQYKTSTYPMMFNTNVWSLLYLGIGLLLTGEGLAFIIFASRFPWVLVQMVTFSFASAIGQNFIFMTVTSFGPLTCSICTTTRKFFTILASVIIFSHPMVGRQWLGTMFVFVGLGLDSAYGKERKKK